MRGAAPLTASARAMGACVGGGGWGWARLASSDPFSEYAAGLLRRFCISRSSLSAWICSTFEPSRGPGARELLRLARQLDCAGKLHLALPDEVSAEDRVNLLAVYKNPQLDRTVWDRRRRNWREAHLRDPAADLPAGYEFAEFELGPSESAYVFCDDLADFYPSVDASDARAATNALAVEVRPDEFGTGLNALRRFRSDAVPLHVFPCAKTLVMGDLNAVDWATGAHQSILQDAGALAPSVQVTGSRPSPPRRSGACACHRRPRRVGARAIGGRAAELPPRSPAGLGRGVP